MHVAPSLPHLVVFVSLLCLVLEASALVGVTNLQASRPRWSFPLPYRRDDTTRFKVRRIPDPRKAFEGTQNVNLQLPSISAFNKWLRVINRDQSPGDNHLIAHLPGSWVRHSSRSSYNLAHVE